MPNLIYLGSPFSSIDKEVEYFRFLKACKCFAALTKQGKHIFSPIVQCFIPARYFGLPGEFSFWSQNCKLIISKCAEFYVLKIDGWDTSIGLTAELKIANKFNLRIKYVDEDGNEILGKRLKKRIKAL